MLGGVLAREERYELEAQPPLAREGEYPPALGRRRIACVGAAYAHPLCERTQLG
jgi:hypothetical protein